MTTQNKKVPQEVCIQLASQIERQLLPGKSPEIDGADISGWCVYSGRLGGDFFDYHNFQGVCCSSQANMRMIVGDATGHGVGSALLMTSTRSYFRIRAMRSGDLSQVVSDVNRLLCMDFESSGNFVTAFYASVNGIERKIDWVRAGQNPALIYDPLTDRFDILRGKGMALGVDPETPFPLNTRSDLPKGTIIIIATDGLWEIKSGDTRTFGEKIVKDTVRKHRHGSAVCITDSVKKEISQFFRNQDSVMDDDITFMAVKFI